MLMKVSDTLRKSARGWLILVLLGGEILFNAILLPKVQARLVAVSNGSGPIDLLFFYTPEKVYSMVASYGEAGRAFYR
ncbi:MAG TPA: hypothetical protein VGJ22_05080, partial [Anaerolineales bacterium]